MSMGNAILMDEPFGALDVQTKEAMQQFLLHIWENTGTTILMITHDVVEAVFLSQRIYVLRANPGTIQKEFKIELPSQRSFKIKRTNQFQDYTEKIMDLLRENQEELIFAV